MNGILRTLTVSLIVFAMGLHAFGFTKILTHCHGSDCCEVDHFSESHCDVHEDCLETEDVAAQENGSDKDGSGQEEHSHHHVCAFCKQLQGVAGGQTVVKFFPPRDFPMLLNWEQAMPDNPVLEREIPPRVA
jgi:hypothetical protein